MTFSEIVLILHILGAGVLIGVVFFSLVLVLKPSTDTSQLRLVRPFGLYAAIWQLATGVMLAFPEWSKFGHSKVFWVKMAFFVIDGIIAERLINRKLQLAENNQLSPDIKLWSWLSLLVVVTIVALGVILVEG